MKITTSSTESGTSKGPADWFTGDVYIDAVASASAPARVMAKLGPLRARSPNGVAQSPAR